MANQQEKHKLTGKEKLQAIVGLAVIVLLLGKCGYEMTGPHTCAEARNERERAQEWWEQNQLPKNDFEASARNGAWLEFKEAEQDEYRLCNE
jgi:hypothetical protein